MLVSTPACKIVRRDDVMAYMLYDMAYVLVDVEKKGFRLVFAQNRERIAEKLSRDDIFKAKRMARECEKKNYSECGF